MFPLVDVIEWILESELWVLVLST